jgi:hypothetical protein
MGQYSKLMMRKHQKENETKRTHLKVQTVQFRELVLRKHQKDGANHWTS